MRLLVFNYDNYVRGHAKRTVVTFYDTRSVNRRKSVLSLAGFIRDTKSVFKRKRNCFVQFSKRCPSTHRFRPSALQRSIRFENAFIPSVRMLKWTPRMRISIYRPAKLAPFLISCCWVLLWFRILDIFLLNDAKNSCKATKTENRGRASRGSFYLRFSLSWQGQKP